jgi:putative DNA primase/helicase
MTHPITTDNSTLSASASNFKNSKNNRLSDKHYKECVIKRGLNPEWIAVNCRSMDIKEASARLGYTAKSAGIWLEGVNGFGQFRPNRPWKADGDKKAPKYRTATGEEYDAMLPRNPHDPEYWENLEALKALCYTMDGHPCLLLTEGLFKAICGCSNGFPTVALAGVEQGLTPSKKDPQGKRFLVPILELLCRAGFGFIIAFDADESAETNLFVAQAQRKLAHQLAKFNVPVYIVTGLWTAEQGKGMDDYIQENGADAFRENVLNRAVNIEAWERQFQEKDKQLLTPKQAAQELAERYETQWKFDLEQLVWRRYNGKIWERMPDKVFEKAVYHDLELMTNVDYKTFSYLQNVVKFLELQLQQRFWESYNRAEWIAFNDRVLEVATGKQHEHSPGFMFTSCLDHNCPNLSFNSGGDLLELLRIHAPTFYTWAMYAQDGDPMKVLKLLAIFNGVLTYQFFDLQMFVLLCGVPGSGKGTFARLLESAVGKQNHFSAKMHRLGEDNTIASIIDKQLVVCPDEKKQSGDNSGILALTGGDSIAYRQIYKPMASARFYGALIILANANPFFGDTTGIDRRWSLVQFNKSLPARDTAVERQMQQEIGVIISLALSMKREQVTSLITGTGDGAIPDFKRQQWLHKTENDSIALFMEEMLVHAPSDQYVMLGGKGDDPSTLYGAYMKMCDENNTRNVFTKNNFRSHLLELCRETGWTQVRESRCRAGWRLYGVRLREFNDPTPRISDWLGGVQISYSECRPSVELSVDLKPLPDNENVESVDFSQPKAPPQLEQQLIVVDHDNSSNVEGVEVYTSTLPLPSEDSSPMQAQHSVNTGNSEPTPGSTLPPSTTQQMINRWDNKASLGELILSLKPEELQAAVAGFTPEQLQYVKDAANCVWRPGFDRDADYNGSCCEIWEAGQSKNIVVRIRQSGHKFTVKRGNLRPWLGI